MKSIINKGVSKAGLFLVFFLVLFTMTAAAQDSLNVKKHTLSEKKFARKMHKPSAVILDVRTPEEFREGHLPQARNINVLADDFKEQIAPLDKTKTYLIYCKSGRRSERALKILHAAGFTNVYHLKEGYAGWDGEKVK